MTKLTVRQEEVLRHIHKINEASGDGARLPSWELIAAANELEGIGLVKTRRRGRYLTKAGLSALSALSQPADTEA